MLQQCRWHPYTDTSALTAAVREQVLAAAAQAVAARGAFHIVLAGGTTPKKVYAALVASAADWRRWHVWFGDERCLPADDPERNSRMASEAWLAHVPIPADQVHAIPAEMGADAAAAAYARALADVGLFDLVLLGLGEDGHTASLFPGQAHGDETRAAIAVHGAPKPPPDRVSLSAARLAAALRVLFLVSGAGKRAAVAAWRRGEALPAACVCPAQGVDVYLDAGLV